MGLRGKGTNHPCHIAGEDAHGLQALQILCGFALSAAVDAVPVLGGDNGHVVDSEVLIQSVEGSTGSSSAAYCHRCSRFVSEERGAGLEHPIKQCAEGAVGTRIIDG